LRYLHDLGYDAFLDGWSVLVHPERRFIVSSHIDTVRPYVPFSFNGEYAYGRGVCDAKASVAAILLALERLDRPRFGVALLHDEEEGGTGSRSFCQRYRPERAVVMEPTNLSIVRVQHGGFEARIRARGRAAHGSLPQHGVNAIEKCLKVLEGLRRLENVTVSVQQVVGGGEEYVIPEECIMRVEVTFRPEVRVGEVIKRVREICAGSCELEVKDPFDGFTLHGETPRLLEEAFRMAGVEVRYSEMVSWTDAVNLRSAGCDVAIFGPGELACCHTRWERVRVRDIEAARDILIALNGLLG